MKEGKEGREGVWWLVVNVRKVKKFKEAGGERTE